MSKDWLSPLFRQVAIEFMTELNTAVTGAVAEQRERATSRTPETSEDMMTSATDGVELADDLEDAPFSAHIERASKHRPASESESELARTVLADLNARPGHFFRKVHQGAASGSGEPDLDGCVRGRTVKIELKVAGGTRKNVPTDKQHRRLLQWQAAGALVGWATSLRQVDEILARLDDPTYRYNGQAGAPAPAAPPEPEA